MERKVEIKYYFTWVKVIDRDNKKVCKRDQKLMYRLHLKFLQPRAKSAVHGTRNIYASSAEIASIYFIISLPPSRTYAFASVRR